MTSNCGQCIYMTMLIYLLIGLYVVAVLSSPIKHGPALEAPDDSQYQQTATGNRDNAFDDVQKNSEEYGIPDPRAVMHGQNHRINEHSKLHENDEGSVTDTGAGVESGVADPRGVLHGHGYRIVEHSNIHEMYDNSKEVTAKESGIVDPNAILHGHRKLIGEHNKMHDTYSDGKSEVHGNPGMADPSSLIHGHPSHIEQHEEKHQAKRPNDEKQAKGIVDPSSIIHGHRQVVGNHQHNDEPSFAPNEKQQQGIVDPGSIIHGHESRIGDHHATHGDDIKMETKLNSGVEDPQSMIHGHRQNIDDHSMQHHHNSNEDFEEQRQPGEAHPEEKDDYLRWQAESKHKGQNIRKYNSILSRFSFPNFADSILKKFEIVKQRYLLNAFSNDVPKRGLNGQKLDTDNEDNQNTDVNTKSIHNRRLHDES